MGSLTKVTIQSTNHGELEYYFSRWNLVQPSLDITCSRADFKLVYENGIINKYNRKDNTLIEQVGTVKTIASDRVIYETPMHL